MIAPGGNSQRRTGSPPQEASSPLLIFEHIPKTAGRTINWILYRMFDADQVWVSEKKNTHAEQFAMLADRLRADPNSVRAVRTHGGYSPDRGLPPNIPVVNFVFLRDPIARTISHYHSQLRRKRVPAETSLDQWLDARANTAFNLQTRYLSGQLWNQHVSGEYSKDQPPSLDDTEVERAFEHLTGRLTCFGLLDRFDQSLHLFREKLGFPWYSSFYLRCNVSPPKEYPQRLIDRVASYNQLDLLLYQRAKAAFDQRLRETSAGGRFCLTAQRAANAAFNLGAPVVYPLASLATGRGWRFAPNS